MRILLRLINISNSRDNGAYRVRRERELERDVRHRIAVEQAKTLGVFTNGSDMLCRSSHPVAREIVVAVVVTNSGRPLPRIGGLQASEIVGQDGLR